MNKKVLIGLIMLLVVAVAGWFVWDLLKDDTSELLPPVTGNAITGNVVHIRGNAINENDLAEGVRLGPRWNYFYWQGDSLNVNKSISSLGNNWLYVYDYNGSYVFNPSQRYKRYIGKLKSFETFETGRKYAIRMENSATWRYASKKSRCERHKCVIYEGEELDAYGCKILIDYIDSRSAVLEICGEKVKLESNKSYISLNGLKVFINGIGFFSKDVGVSYVKSAGTSYVKFEVFSGCRNNGNRCTLIEDETLDSNISIQFISSSEVVLNHNLETTGKLRKGSAYRFEDNTLIEIQHISFISKGERLGAVVFAIEEKSSEENITAEVTYQGVLAMLNSCIVERSAVDTRTCNSICEEYNGKKCISGTAHILFENNNDEVMWDIPITCSEIPKNLVENIQGLVKDVDFSCICCSAY